MQFRFRVTGTLDTREIVNSAMLSSLCGSERCKRWELLTWPGDPGRLMLHMQWEGDDEQEIFRGSSECSDFFRALGARVGELEESDYRADEAFLLASLGGAQGMLQLVSEILHEVSLDPLLALRFGPGGGERVGRLGLWLIEVLGGPRLYSAATPVAALRVGPLPEQPLDVEERAQLLELARGALHVAAGRGHSALGALEANLPLHPALPFPSVSTPIAPQVAPASELSGRWALNAPSLIEP